MSQPWLKFYPRDWRGDQALRAVSIAARGLWMECLCIMHTGTPYGHLTLNGRPVDIPTLARMVGIDSSEAQTLMDELIAAGVCKVKRGGVMFSKRMVKDASRAEKGRKAVETRYSQYAETIEQNDAPNRSPTTQIPEGRKQRAEPRKKKEGKDSVGTAIAAPPDQIVVAQVLSDVDIAIEAFNSQATSCPKWASSMGGEAHRKLVAQRLEEAGLDGFKRALSLAAASHLGGPIPNENEPFHGWRMDLAWFTSKAKFHKILGGGYGPRGRQQLRGRDSARAGLMEFMGAGGDDE